MVLDRARSAPWLPAALLLVLGACEPMESTGAVFSPAHVAPPPSAPGAPAAVDPAFAFTTDPVIELSSEELAKGDATVGLAAAAGVDPTKLPDVPVVADAAPAPAAAPPSVGVPAAVQWPVRLLSTLPQAQPPRAILGLPSGEERVVSPGSILAEQGLVVMAVTADKVSLARVQAAGDHATIEPLELSAQYGTAPQR